MLSMVEVASSSTVTRPSLLLLRDRRDARLAVSLIRGREPGAVRWEPLALREEAAGPLRDAGVACRVADGSDLAPPHEIRKQTLGLLRSLGRVVIDGQPLPHFLAKDGVSLWPFAPSYLFPALEEAVATVDLLVRIMRRCQPERLVAVRSSDGVEGMWARSLRTVACRFGVPLCWWDGRCLTAEKVEGLPTGSFDTASSGVWHGAFGPCDARELLAGVWGYLVSRLNFRRSVGGSRTVVFVSHARNWVRAFDPPRKQFDWIDEQCYPVLPSLVRKNSCRVVGIDCFYGAGRKVSLPIRLLGVERWKGWSTGWTAWALAHRVLAERRIRWQSLYGYADRRTWQAVRSAWRWCQKRFDRFQRCPAVGEVMTYEGVRLDVVLAPELKEVFTRRLAMCCGYLRMARTMLETERPSVCLLSYETGPLGRAVVVAAAQAGVPTVGLQHGVVYPGSSDYTHEPDTVSMTDPLAAMIPTVMCVYGDAARRTFTASGGYPERAIAVTGHWRWDRYVKEWGSEERRDLAARLGLPADQRIVLLATTTIPTTEAQVRAVACAVRTMGDVMLVVKPHPSEEPSLHARVLCEESVLQGCVVTGYLPELLVLADAVVTEFSTVGLEAAFLGKPVVWTRYYRGPAFLAAGASVGETVDDPEHLAGAIRRALDRSAGEGRAASESVFMREQFSEPDGRAAERVAVVVRKLCGWE